MPITIREVAAAAGVSPAAASKVLHGRGESVRVGAERAEHIRKVAIQLNYRPNLLARSLRTGRTNNVGLVFDKFGSIADGPLYYMDLLEGVASTLFPQHYRLTILPELPTEDPLSALGDGQLDGVIWCKLARDEKALRLIHDAPLPIVAMNAPAPAEPTEAVFVACDNEGGIELAVDHLWSQGHRHILFVREEEELDSPDQMARAEAFRVSMARRNAQADVVTWDWYGKAFAAWWANRPPHTALIGWSERCASMLLRQADANGVRLPEQVSLVGFDSTRYCETTRPRLTAVRQPIRDMARHATETLLDLIRGCRPEKHSFVFPCALDVRDSTAPIPNR